MRTPTSGVSSALTATVSQPCFLVQIALQSGPSYMTDLDSDFSYNGQIWASSDLQVQGISWIAGKSQNLKLTLGDADLTWWTLALGLELQDCVVSIWQAYASAPNEALALWSGRIGAVTRGAATVECTLVTDMSIAYAPRRRVQSIINPQYLLPTGKVIVIGSQKFVLDRQYSG